MKPHKTPVLFQVGMQTRHVAKALLIAAALAPVPSAWGLSIDVNQTFNYTTNVTSSVNWSSLTWTPAVVGGPTGAGTTVGLNGGAVAASRTLTMDSNPTLKQMQIYNSDAFVLTGGTITWDSNAAGVQCDLGLNRGSMSSYSAGRAFTMDTAFVLNSDLRVTNWVEDTGSRRTIINSTVSGGGKLTIRTFGWLSTSPQVRIGGTSANIHTGGTTLEAANNIMRASTWKTGAFGTGVLTLTGANAVELDLYNGTTSFDQSAGGLVSGSNQAHIVKNSGATVKTLTLNLADAVTTTYGKSIGSGGTNLALTINKASGANGTGVQVLSGTNTYTGNTIISGGTLQFGKRVSLYNAGAAAAWTNANLIQVSNGATLAVNVGAGDEFTSTDLDTLKGLGGLASGARLGIDTTNATGSFSYGSNIGNAIGITKLGTGTLALSGTNTYTGGTKLSGGTLSVAATGHLGDSSSALTFDGGTLQITGTALTNLSGIGHAVSFTAGKVVGLDIADSGNTFTADQVLNQTTGGLTKLGAGTLVLNQINTYTGLTTVSAGELDLNTTGGQAIAGNLTVSGGTAKLLQADQVNSAKNLVVSSGTFNLQSYNQTLANVQMTGGNINGSSGVLTGSNAFDMQAGSASAILDGSVGLNKTTGGTVTLSGANTYTGATAIDAGTLSAGNIVVAGGSSNLGNAVSAVTLGSASAQGTLSYSGNSATYVRGFTIGGAGGGRVDVTASGQTLSIATNDVTGSGLFTIGGAGNTTIDSSIIHTGGLTKADAGTLTLNNTNTYSGLTTISGGAIVLGSGGSIPNTTGVSLGTSGNFDVSAKGGYTVTALTGSGSVTGALTVSTTLAIGNSPGAVDFSSNLTLGSGTSYNFDVVGGTTGAGSADLGNVAGTLYLGGATLNLTQLGTYTPNEKFTLFSYQTGVSGTFAGLADGGVFNDLGSNPWQINYNDTAGTNGGTYLTNVTITAIPETSAAVLGALGMLALLRRRRA